MEKKDIKDILNKVESGDFNAQEEQMAKLWLFQLHNKNRAKLSESKLDRASQQIWRRLEGNTAAQSNRIRLWPRIAVAASIVLVLSVGGYFYLNSQKSKTLQTAAYATDVAPGKQGATLTLASGRKIKLSDAANGEIAKEAGISVNKTTNGQLVYEINPSLADQAKQSYNTLTTTKGETYILTLPDGSLVYLNAASSLTYSAALLEHGMRKVKLAGEAYFEVAKDKAHPFVVESRGQQVEVLGTHFNINAYSDEANTKTTLLEGSVKILSLPFTASLRGGMTKQSANPIAILKPGQQSVLNGKDITVKEVDIAEATAWKNGDFIFRTDDFKTVMRKVARWYDVEIIYDKSAPADVPLFGEISRSKNISAILSIMEATGDVHFKIEGRRVIVTQ